MSDMLDDHIIPVLLCGGQGRRLSPIANKETPKPVTKLKGEALCMLQTTFLRTTSFGPAVLVTQDSYAQRIRSLLADLTFSYPYDLLSEPMARDTAAAVALAALYLGNHPERMMLVLPIDHAIAREEEFRRAVHKAAENLPPGKVTLFGANAESAEPS